MLSDWVIKEIDRVAGGRVRLHVIDLHEGNYRQSVSFNAFFHGLKKRNWTETRVYAAEHKSDFEIGEACWKRTYTRMNMAYEVPPTIHHASLWDFYRHIGYDYKTKHFVKGNP